MKRLLSLLLLSALTGSLAFAALPAQEKTPAEPEAQDEPLDPQALAAEYSAKFQEGIDALTAGEYDKGIAAFKRCLELVPVESTCAFNVACGYSLKGDVDAGLEWLQKSAELGFGDTEANIEHVGEDGDLANLREDERFAGVVQYMKDRNTATKAYWSEPLIHVPASLKDVEKVPVLVVLHDMNETKQQVFDRGWKELCDELGMVLLVPGAMLPSGLNIQEGASWFKNINEYMNRYWTFEEPITKGFDALKERGKKLDRGQVYMTGVGQGGFVGFTAALRSPSRYGGAVVFDTAMALQAVASKGPKAGEAGFSAAIYVSDTMFGVPPSEIDEACAGQSPALAAWKIGDKIHRMEKTEDMHAARVALVKSKLQEWRKPAPKEEEAAEAESPK